MLLKEGVATPSTPPLDPPLGLHRLAAIHAHMTHSHIQLSQEWLMTSLRSRTPIGFHSWLSWKLPKQDIFLESVISHCIQATS